MKKKMTVAAAKSVLSTVYGGLLPPGALWVNGLLDDLPEAKKTLERAAKRNAAAREQQKKVRSKRRKGAS
jgi:hypothetical protein